jgi:methylenetetrahydrofolate dehydrogenase (NADP+)/methenyltetrahydrofolate cyclohydrolase
VTRILTGKPVADETIPALLARIERLEAARVTPRLAVVRVGERPNDLAYETNIAKRAEFTGVRLTRATLPPDTDAAQVSKAVRALASDDGVHGILVLRPFPEGVDEVAALVAIPAGKDVDGVTAEQMAALYAMKRYDGAPDAAFFPCTAEAVIRMLDHYGISVEGKRAVVIGRSAVVGKPVATLLLARDATVTLCHSRTRGLAELARRADILVCAAGLAAEGRGSRLGAECFKPGQTIIDIAINADGGGLYGDADPDAAMDVVADITPVPGGLGAVTSVVLMEHVVRAAEAAAGIVPVI